MEAQTRTKSYSGLFRSQAEEAFRRDAVEAVSHGWQPTAQQWTGLELVVTYTYGTRPPAVQLPPPVALPDQAPARKDSPWAMVAAVVALVALGAITGLAVSGQGPFGSESRGAAPANVRPYVPSVQAGSEGAADAASATTTCEDWDSRLEERRRHALAAGFLSGFRREQGTEPVSPPDDDVYLMSGILDALCAEPGNAAQDVGALATLVWLSEALED